jgi:L-fucose mutarotase/ribose pyranase (RbsD/FucU family)
MTEQTGFVDPLAQVKDLRRRVVRGDDVSDSELKEAILALQSFRNKVEPAAKASSTAKAKTKAEPKVTSQDAADLLSDLL